jgi:AraC-like DNA-binding protein
MINAMVTDKFFGAGSTTPISSAYCIVLSRYLAYLQNQQTPWKESISKHPSFEELGNVTSIERIIPLLEQIEGLTGNSCFGLDIGKNMHPSDYGVFGYAMMNCQNLLCALKTAAQHKSILNQKLSADLTPDGDEFIYQLNINSNAKAVSILIELDFSTAFEFAQRLAGPGREEVVLNAVHFKHQPLGPRDRYTERFNCPVYFESNENRLRISKKVLDTPIYGANSKVLSALEDKIVSINRKQSQTLSFADQVAHHVKKNMRWELPSAQLTARAFNMSVSTLKNRLSAEQTNYQKVCDDVRYEHCKHLIEKGSIAIKEVAFELGFANASAFNRAFRRWTGKSPSEFKKTCALALQ